MLDKLKQLKQLKDFHDSAKKERFESTVNGVKVVLNGSLQVEEIILNPGLSENDQSQALKQAFNEGLHNVQMSMAQKFQGMNINL
ncbi:MAG: YbaB/EbfC family nucleoid-associated protein [Patescibacteria group bacterium]|jgi:DNA-binding protein YbaB|nr:YbaB/EbfC family nucleoid-associated protein [Patescibacteria group bacterium]